MSDDQQLFVLTKRVKEALELINALDETKLAVCAKRVVCYAQYVHTIT
jgi:hypothetical protein